MKASDPHTYSVSVPSENIRVIGSNSLAVVTAGKSSWEAGVTLIDTLVGAEVVASIATHVDATQAAQRIQVAINEIRTSLTGQEIDDNDVDVSEGVKTSDPHARP
jgi:hypothetical protein